MSYLRLTLLMIALVAVACRFNPPGKFPQLSASSGAHDALSVDDDGGGSVPPVADPPPTDAAAGDMVGDGGSGVDGGGDPDAGATIDTGATIDAGESDAGESDAGMSADAGACTSAGMRVCVDPMHSGSCAAAGAAPVIERTCPPGSNCMGGACAPPAGATSCASSITCSGGQVCDLYVVGTMLAGYCTDPVSGGGAIYAQCNVYGDDPTCQTGLCALDAEDNNHHQCLFPCASDNDCPRGNSCHLVGPPSSIEGVSTAQARACFH